MPLKLVAPRPGKTPNWTIRGTYLKVSIDQSAGTPDKRIAQKKLNQLRQEIEAGEFAKPSGPTFAEAALAYVKAGGEQRFVLRLAEHFGDLPLERIDQSAIDKAALALYPTATAATRNRQVYSPISAVLHHMNIQIELRRPKGANGARRLFWLTPEQAAAIIAAAQDRDKEFGTFCMFLLYTGCRLSEGLNLQVADVSLKEQWAHVRETKNGAPRIVHLPRVLASPLSQQCRGRSTGKVFRFSKNGRLYIWLADSARAAGVVIPSGIAFHAFRHTWGAWCRRYGGLDTTGLVATGAWKSRQAAAVYEHAVQSEEARRAELLPDITRRSE